jgi:pimeloyl-ACP methyl ester carboxylesterase
MPSQPVEHSPTPSPRRRFVQQLAMGVTAASVAACTTPAAKRNQVSAAPTFVLVHGAWYGGWCWRKLTPLLAQAGCAVHTPTLTALGERAHLGGRETTLQTHAQDLQAVLQMHDLRDVILVGHSYAGMVTSLVAERERARIKQLVYLDAFVPEDGKRVVDYLLPLERREAIAKIGAETGFVPPVPATALGVSDAEDLAWINARVVKQPFATFNEPVRLTAPAGAGLLRTYIACIQPASGSFGQFADKLRDDPGWQFKELRTGHNAMVTAPQALAKALLAA